MDKPITPEMIAAWRTLQSFAERNRHNTSIDYLKEAADAIDVLDNSDFMVPIEDAEGDANDHVGLPTLAPGEEIRLAFSDTHPRAARELGEIIGGEQP